MAKIRDYRIVISAHASPSEQRAAAFLRENIKLVCGKKLAIVRDDTSPSDLEIVVGKTEREVLDGLSFDRSRTGLWEYVMLTRDCRFYMTGLGTAPEELPYTSAYRKLDDGGVGTVIAAYHFVEDILGYDFIYAAYDEFPEDPELEMPAEYRYDFTREAFRAQRPKKIDGAAMYFLQCSERLDWNNQSVIIKSKTGKIAVFDGGHPEETDRLLAVLRDLTGEEVPRVNVWLFSHLHEDHYGVYLKLCRDEAYRGKLKVDHFYCNLITEEFYTKQSPEAAPFRASVRNDLLNSEQTVGAKVHTVEVGEVVDLDDIKFEVLHVPQEEFATKMNMNDSSVVYRMTCEKGQSVMFLGDAEWVCSNDLVEHCADKLKSDIVQVGHHGCGNVSRKCYELIGADAYIWPVGERFWYGESGEGLNTHNVGVERYRVYMRELGAKPENIYVNMDSILAFPLPMKIH